MLYRPDGAAGLLDQARCRSCGDLYEGDRFARLMAHVEREQAEQEREKARKKREKQAS
jgi:hypothetical protein